MPSVPTQQSNIYQIRCSATGKIYIGSAVNIQQRWTQHRRRLRTGNHHNTYLQAAWNKYGEEGFEFSVLEIVDPKLLLATEQAWIERTRCADRQYGFNIFDVAGSPGKRLFRCGKGSLIHKGMK